MKSTKIFHLFYLKILNLASPTRPKGDNSAYQQFYIVIFAILISVWIVSLALIGIGITKREAEHEALKEKKFAQKMSESIEQIDNYCRQLDRIELTPRFEFKIRPRQDGEAEKEESRQILENVKKEKLIRDNVIWFPEFHQMWCLVPKAASTSWSSLLKENLNQTAWNSSYLSQNASSQLPTQVILRQIYGHVNKQEYEKAVQSEAVKRILLVRHPFARIASAFEDKLKNRKERTDGMYFFQTYGSMIYRKYRRNRALKQREPTFDEFVQYLIDTDPMDYDEHWKPISLLCGLCTVRYDFVIKVEELSSILPGYGLSLFNQLKFKTRRSLPWLNKIDSSHHQNTSNYFKSVSKSKILQLYKKYEHDFHLFGYGIGEYSGSSMRNGE